MAERSVLVRLIAENGSFDAAMSTSAKKVETVGTSADRAARVARSAMGEIRAAAATILGVSALASGQSLINLEQQAQTAFTAITGDAAKASAQIQQIYQWDQSNPIPFQNALAAGQKLAAFGVNLQDVVPTLQAIADATGAVGGNADTFDRVVTALGQIQAKGKLSAEEVMQLAEANIPVWQLLATQLGVTVPDAMKMTQKGAIDADTALTALRDGIEQKFPGAAQKLKDTTLGAWQSLKAGIRNAAVDILDPLQNVEKQGSLTASSLIQSFGQGVGTTLQGLTSALGGLSGALGGLGTAASAVPAPVAAMGTAMLGTNLASKQLASGWETLQIKGLYALDSIKSFGAAVGSIPGKLTSLSEASAAGRAAMASIASAGRSAASGLLSAFGGPLGLAIVGTTTALSLWGDAQNRDRDATEKHRASLSELKDTFDRVSGAITGATTAKIIDQLGDGVGDTLKRLHIDFDLAVQAAKNGGTAFQTFRQQIIDQGAAAFQASDQWSKFSDELAASGETADQFAHEKVAGLIDVWGKFGEAGIKAGSDMDVLHSAIFDIVDAYGKVKSEGDDVSTGMRSAREDFEHLAASAATVGHVTKDQMVSALDQAYASGTSLQDALNGIGITGAAQTPVLAELSSVTTQGAGGMTYLAGAAGTASGALTTVAGSAKDAAAAIKAAQDSMDELNNKVNKVYAGLLQQAKDLRDSVQSSVAGFVSPLQAWNDAVDAVNQKTKRVAVSDNPAVKAAEAAVKAAQKQKDATQKSADAERDAAIKSAQAIRDGVVAKAKADADSARSAQQAAQQRLDAARDEASEFKKLADQRKKDAQESQDALTKATLRLESAKKEVESAQLARDTATDPRTRAQWQLALNSALEDETNARKGLASAQADYNTKSKANTDTQAKAQKAADEQKSAEADLAAAKARAAKVSDDASKRQDAADKALADARDKANLRYQKAVDAATAHLDALRDKQDAVRDSAQKMADASADAVSGMVKKAQPSFSQWLQQLSDQKQAQQEWADNLRSLAKKLPSDVVSYLAGLGPGAADMIAQMNSQSVGELGKAVPLIRSAMPDWATAMTDGILASIPGSQAAMAGMGDKAIQSLIDALNSGKEPTRKVLNDLGYDLAVDAAGNPIIFPIGIDSTGADAYLKTWAAQQSHALTVALGRTSYSSGGGVGGYASGTMSAADGWSWVGEQGPELMHKSGSSVQIYPAGQSAAMQRPAPDSGPRVQINLQMSSVNAVAEPDSVVMRRALDAAASVASAI